MATKSGDDDGVDALKECIRIMHDSAKIMHESVDRMREERCRPWPQPPDSLDKTGWNFGTYDVYIKQRFSDLSLQLQQRFEAQQTSVSTAMVAAEKAVNAALTAAEKAVDKAEQAQALRNEAQNEFRKSLSDLSGLMWTTKEGTAALEALRREIDIRNTGIEGKVNAAAAQSANLQGRFAMLGIVWGAFVVIISGVGSLLVKWIN